MKYLANYLLLFVATALPTLMVVIADIASRTRGKSALQAHPLYGSAFMDLLATPAGIGLAGLIVTALLGKELMAMDFAKKLTVNAIACLAIGIVFSYAGYVVETAKFVTGP